jgi:L-rhamnose mutarotase
MEMKEKYIKRFCLAGKSLSPDAFGMRDEFDINFGRDKNFRETVVSQIEAYRTGGYHIILLDVHPQIYLEDIRNSLPVGSPLQWLIDSEKLVLLRRIFKKKPRPEGMVFKINEYTRTVMTLELKNDPELLREYVEIHRLDNIWAQVLKNMDDIGILDMEIYLFDYHVFLIMDTRPDFDLEREGERWANMPQEREWQRFVAKFQKTDPDSKTL